MVSSDEGKRRQGIYQELNHEQRLGSSLTVLFSQAAAECLGVHSTDIETIDILHVMGPMTAGRLSEITGLSTGATTRLIDRMERAGFARRRPDPQDRRRVVVEVSMQNWERIVPLFGPLGHKMAELWSTFSVEELQTVLSFTRQTNQILSEENARLRRQSEET